MNNESFVLWNNKGGVGKSTITFHLASRYAELHENEDVMVLDMCPQANSSMMLLGGGKDAERKLQELITSDIPKTVVGYITDVITNSASDDLTNYFTKVHDLNNHMPENLWLLSGDGNLELIAPLLSERAEMPSLTASDQPWVKIHSILKKLTLKRINPERKCTYFIDTNPSFSIYTQMSILAGRKLLVPINADDSSIYAIIGLFNLIWGGTNQHPVYGKYTFASKVNEFNMERPKIAQLLGNRFTQKIGAANAFKAVSEEASNKMYEEYKTSPERFISHDVQILSKNAFKDFFLIELRDFNSAGVVAANQGIPLSKMSKRVYELYDMQIQVSKEQVEACQETIEEVTRKILDVNSLNSHSQ